MNGLAAWDAEQQEASEVEKWAERWRKIMSSDGTSEQFFAELRSAWFAGKQLKCDRCGKLLYGLCNECNRIVEAECEPKAVAGKSAEELAEIAIRAMTCTHSVETKDYDAVADALRPHLLAASQPGESQKEDECRRHG